jgi:hypothetical protein
MKRKGMWADFTEEDIELMIAIRRDEEERALKAAQKSARAKRAAKARGLEPAPDRRTVSKKKKTDKKGPSSLPRD